MSTQNTIKVSVRNVYGTDMVYPACERATTFAAIAGKRTFTHDDLVRIESLGFVIEVETPKLRRA